MMNVLHLSREWFALPFINGGEKRSQKGMTLFEIMIVVAILASLAALLVRNLSGQADSAKIDQAKIAMGNIAQSLQLYRVHTNRFPTTSQGLDALVTNPGNSPRWRGPYLEKDKLADPWGTPFNYSSDGYTFEVVSAGPSLQFGDDDDISYPPSKDENAAPAAAEGGG